MNQLWLIKLVSASAMKMTMIVTNASRETSTQKEKRRIRHPTLLTIPPLSFTKDLLAEAVPAKRKNTLCLHYTENHYLQILLMSLKKYKITTKPKINIHWQLHLRTVYLEVQLVHRLLSMLFIDFQTAFFHSHHALALHLVRFHESLYIIFKKSTTFMHFHYFFFKIFYTFYL